MRVYDWNVHSWEDNFVTNVELVLVRHAIAEERREGLPEAERALTERGRERFRKLLVGYAKLGVRPTAILSSPWTRASETAALFKRHYPDATYGSLDGLARPPDHALVRRLSELSDTSTVLIGHEPWLSQLCGFLTIGRFDSSVRLKKGGLIWLRGHPTAGGMLIQIMLAPALTLKLLDTQG